MSSCLCARVCARTSASAASPISRGSPSSPASFPFLSTLSMLFAHAVVLYGRGTPVTAVHLRIPPAASPMHRLPSHGCYTRARVSLTANNNKQKGLAREAVCHSLANTTHSPTHSPTHTHTSDRPNLHPFSPICSSRCCKRREQGLAPSCVCWGDTDLSVIGLCTSWFYRKLARQHCRRPSPSSNHSAQVDAPTHLHKSTQVHRRAASPVSLDRLCMNVCVCVCVCLPLFSSLLRFAIALLLLP